MRRKVGFLTERQIEILKLRRGGLTAKEIAKRLGTTRENVSMLERRALRNIKRAKETIEVLKHVGIVASVNINPNTSIIDATITIMKKADKENIKLKTSFAHLLEEIRFKAGKKVKGRTVVETITVYLFPDGDYLID